MSANRSVLWQNAATEFESEVIQTAIVCSLGLSASLASYAALRSGLSTPYSALFTLFFGFFAIVVSPVVFARFFSRGKPINEFAYPFSVIGLLVIPPVLFPGLVVIFFSTLGVASILLLITFFRSQHPRIWAGRTFGSRMISLGIPILLILCSTFAAISAKHSQQVSDFFAPELAMLNLLHRDTIHHIAISNMTWLFGYPAAGLDGNSILHYHASAHYWFASISRALDLPTVYGLPISHLLLISLFQFGFLFLTQRTFSFFDVKLKNNKFLISTVILFLCDFFLFSGDIAVYYTSETLTYGLLVLLLGFVAIQQTVETGIRGNTFWRPASALLSVNALLLTLKIVPAFFFSGFISIFLLIRKSRFRELIFWFAPIVFLSVIALVLFTPIYTTLLGAYNPSHLVHPFRFRFGFQLSEITGGAATALFIFLATAYSFLRKGPSKGAPIQRYLLCLSSVLFLALLVGFGDWFNSLREYLFVTSGLLAMTALGPLTLWVHSSLKIKYGQNGPLYTRLTLGLISILTISVIFVGAQDFQRKSERLIHFLHYNVVQIWDGTVGKELASVNVVDYFWENLRKNNRVFSPGIANGLQTGFWPTLAQVVDEQVQDEKRTRTAVFVPPTNFDFWQYTDVDTCTYKPLYVPALLNVPMLKGLPPLGTPCEYVGIGHDYSGFSRKSHSEDIDDTKLCAYALTREVQRVLILNNFALPIDYRVLDCKPARI